MITLTDVHGLRLQLFSYGSVTFFGQVTFIMV